MFYREKYLNNARTIVIKTGSSLLTVNGHIKKKKIKKLVKGLASLVNNNKKVVLISSGAIASAGYMTGRISNPTLQDNQALASIGQVHLMEIYKKYFRRNKIDPAQILIAERTLRDRKSYLNVRNTLNRILEMGSVPIINENDAVSTKEIEHLSGYGENDTLGAVISGLISADLYIILSNVNGLYKNFEGSQKEIIDTVNKIDKKLEKEALGSFDNVGTGGMATKLKAAKTANSFGIPALIANGNKNHILKKIFTGKEGTIFLPSDKLLSNRKKWIVSNIKVSGEIIIDEGAVKALYNKKSLLPMGITEVKGPFHQGDVCEIKDTNGKSIGKGMVNYSSYDLVKIIGKKSGEIEDILGHKPYDEAVHRDNLVVTGE